MPSLQTSPATRHCVPPGAAGMPQVPSVAPDALLQMPPQQSVLLAQESPVCLQNEMLPAQMPLLQTCEQQSALALQVLPEVLQAVFNAMQTLGPPSGPVAHLPPQHCASVVHGWLSEVHSLEPHLPPAQTPVQQSVAAAQA